MGFCEFYEALWDPLGLNGALWGSVGSTELYGAMWTLWRLWAVWVPMGVPRPTALPHSCSSALDLDSAVAFEGPGSFGLSVAQSDDGYGAAPQLVEPPQDSVGQPTEYMGCPIEYLGWLVECIGWLMGQMGAHCGICRAPHRNL